MYLLLLSRRQRCIIYCRRWRRPLVMPRFRIYIFTASYWSSSAMEFDTYASHPTTAFFPLDASVMHVQNPISAVHQCAVELWQLIFEYACLDDGSSGCSLSLVSRYFHEASKGSRYKSIFLTTPNQLRKVVLILTPLPKHLRRVRHLYISAFADPSSVDEEQIKVGYEQRELIRLVAGTLLTLELGSDHPIPATLQLWPCEFVTFPTLSQLTICGTTGEGNMVSTSTHYPALRFLHLANQQSVNDGDLLPILNAVSSLTHLRISGPYRLSDLSLKCLEKLLCLDVGSEVGTSSGIKKVLLQDEGIFLCSAHFNATKIPGVVLLKREHLKHAKNRITRSRWLKEGAGLFWEPKKRETHDHQYIVLYFENYFISDTDGLSHRRSCFMVIRLMSYSQHEIGKYKCGEMKGILRFLWNSHTFLLAQNITWLYIVMFDTIDALSCLFQPIIVSRLEP